MATTAATKDSPQPPRLFSAVILRHTNRDNFSQKCQGPLCCEPFLDEVDIILELRPRKIFPRFLSQCNERFRAFFKANDTTGREHTSAARTAANMHPFMRCSSAYSIITRLLTAIDPCGSTPPKVGSLQQDMSARH